MAPQTQDQIDLSDGLVAKPGMDLSDGLVAKDDATSPPPPNPTWGSSPEDVADTVGSHLAAIPTGLYNMVAHPYDTFVKPTVDAGGRAVSQFKQGNYSDAARSAESAIPIVGPWADNIEKEVGEKGAVAGLSGLATDILGAKAIGAATKGAAGAVSKFTGGRTVVPGENYTPVHRDAYAGVLARGTGAGKSYFAKQVASDITSPVRQAAADNPEIADKAINGTPDESLAAHQSLLQEAQRKIDIAHRQALDPVASTPVDMKPVQDALPKLRDFHDPAERAQVQALRDRAGKVVTLDDLNEFRQYLGKENAARFRQNTVAAGRGSVEDDAYAAADRATRDHYYQQLEDATGQNFQPLKRTESSIISAREALGNAAPSLSNREAIATAPSRFRGTAADVIEGGTRSVHGLPLVGYAAEKLRGTPLFQMQEGLKQALSKLPPPSPRAVVGPARVPPAPPSIRGLLQPPLNEVPLSEPLNQGSTRGGLYPAQVNPNSVPGVDASPRSIYTPEGIIEAPGYLSGGEHPELSGKYGPAKGVLRTRQPNAGKPPLLDEFGRVINHEDHIQDGKTVASAQIPSEVEALLHRTGAKVTNKEAPTSKSVASVDPEQPNTINIDDMERFNKDSNARNQTISHEAVHNWHQNLPPAIQKMIPLDDPKDLYGKDDKGYEQDDLKNMRSQGLKLWNLPREKAAAVIQTYAHLGGDKAPKAVQDVYKPWAQDMVDSPLSGAPSAEGKPSEMHETKILGEDKPKKEKVTDTVPRGTKHPAGEITAFDEETGLPIVRRSLGGSKEPANNPVTTAKPEKEDMPDGKRDVLHASNDREELVAEGKAHAPHLESGLKAAADSVPGAKLEGVRSEKDPGRLDEKIKREGQPVETVPDVLAGRISVDNDDAHKGVVDDIKKHATVVREKDEFKKGDSRFAFRSHKLQVKVSPKMSAEIQVVPKEVAAQDDKQHPVYKQAREAELDGDTEKADALAQKSKAMNDDAKSRFDRRNDEKAGSKTSDKPKEPAATGGDDKAQDPVSDRSHRVGDRVTLPNGKAATVAYAPAKGAQLPTYRFKGDDGTTTTMRASEAHAKVKKADDAGGKPKGWVGVDLDGSLATYDGWKGADHIGKPIPMMVDRIKRMLASGQDVRIFTARIADDKDGSAKKAIEAWTQKHVGQSLPITNVKDQHMTSLYDDRAIQVERNQGHILGSRRKAVAESA